MPGLNTIATADEAVWLGTWFDIAWRGALLLAMATLVTAALRRSSAATRHLVWSVAVLALLLLPVATWVLPSWRAPLPEGAHALLSRLPSIERTATGDSGANMPSAHAGTTPHAALQDGKSPLATSAREPGAERSAESAPTSHARSTSLEAHAGTSSDASARTQASTFSQAHAGKAASAGPASKSSVTPAHTSSDAFALPRVESPQSGNVLAWLLPMWAVGALLVAAWFALQHGSVRYLAYQARAESDSSTLWRVERARRQVGLGRRLRVLRGGVTDMPMTWGFMRPVLLLPEGMPTWPEARQRDVLLHELAHVKRHDHATQLIAQAVCALHWFNPLAWYAARRMMLEREHACDDYVLASGARPSDYAQHLLDVARAMRPQRVGAAAAIAMAGRSTLPGRLRAVLEPGRSRRGLGAWAATGALVVGALFVVPLAAVDLSRPALDSYAVRGARPIVVPSAPLPVYALPRARTVPLEAYIAPLESYVVAPPQVAVSENGYAYAFDIEYDDDVLATPEIYVVPEIVGAADVVYVAPEPSSVVVSPGAAIDVAHGATAYVSPSGVSTAVVVGDGGGSVTEVSVEKGRWNFSWRDGDDRLRIRARGEIELNDDLTDIVSLSHRGYVDLEEERGRRSWRIKLEGERDGSVKRRWWVDGKEQPYGDEARTWLAETLPEFTRRAGFAVDQRVAALLSRGGVEAVLEEIKQVDSDHVVRLYFSELTTQADLSSEQLERVLQHAGETIGSDFELAQLLMGALEEGDLRPEGMIIYARATQTIGSDFEQSRALRALVKRYELDEATLRETLDAARDIGSDFELARLLLEVAREQTFTPSMHRAFFEAARTIGSDFEHRRVLKEFVERDDLAADLVVEILGSAARSIGSDYELAELLVAFAKRRDVQADWVPAYVEALETVGSDYEFRRAAQALIEENTLDDASLVLLLEAAEDSLGSDFEMAQLLVQVARTHTLSEQTREAFLRASDTIGSNHENRRVLSELVKSER